MELIEILRALNQAHGPSGDEGEIREKIAELARPFADELTIDTMGSLIVHKKGDGPRVMFAAHMDSIGFIVTHIEEEGFLRVGRLGGVVPKEAAYSAVRFKNGGSWTSASSTLAQRTRRTPKNWSRWGTPASMTSPSTSRGSG